MKSVLSGIGLILFVAVVVPLVMFPHWIASLIVYLVLLMWLNALDRATGRLIGNALLALFALGYQRVRGGSPSGGLPFIRSRRTPVPPANEYEYRVPGSDQVLTVQVEPSAVYDYYDQGARNPHQYIGKADDPDERHPQHVAKGRPFTNLPRDVQWYPCSCVALAVEKTAIRVLRPVANVVHNTGPLEGVPQGV